MSTVALTILLLALSSRTINVVAFTAKLSPPWTGPLDSGSRRSRDGEDGGLQIITDGDGDKSTSSGEGTGRTRRGGETKKSGGSGSETALRATESDAAESEVGAADRSQPKFPDEASTARAFEEFSAESRSLPIAASAAATPAALAFFPKYSHRDILPPKARPALGRSAAIMNGVSNGGTASGGGPSSSPSVLSYLGSLLAMTRPGNLPGVVLFHVIGIHKTLTQVLLAGRTSTLTHAAAAGPIFSLLPYRTSLLRVLADPRMVCTLLVLLLSSSTSMLVNDYYDARSGVDSLKSVKSPKPLASGTVPMAAAKQFLYYLYAALLLTVPFVPGTVSQLSVIAGAMLTFLYTQHLKPTTWLKNVMCATVISFAPLTSGIATATILVKGGGSFAAVAPAISSLWRMVLTLSSGFMWREITMDVVDTEGDRESGVRTVPVRYGRRFASRAALAFAVFMAIVAVCGPAGRLVTQGLVTSAVLRSANAGAGEVAAAVLAALASRRGDVIRLFLAAISTGSMVNHAVKLCRLDGRDDSTAERAVEESKIMFGVLLASFL